MASMSYTPTRLDQSGGMAYLFWSDGNGNTVVDEFRGVADAKAKVLDVLLDDGRRVARALRLQRFFRQFPSPTLAQINANLLNVPITLTDDADIMVRVGA